MIWRLLRAGLLAARHMRPATLVPDSAGFLNSKAKNPCSLAGSPRADL